MKRVIVEQQARSANEAVSAALGALPRAGSGADLCILLSSALAKPFLFGPIAGLSGWREAHAAACAAAPQRCGVAENCTVVLDNDPAAGTVLATAVANETMDAIRDVARRLRVQVRSVRPAWAWAMDQSSALLGEAQVFACRDADGVVLLADIDSSWRLAASHHGPAVESDGLEALIRRATLSLEQQVAAAACASVVAHPPLTEPSVTWARLELAQSSA